MTITIYLDGFRVTTDSYSHQAVPHQFGATISDQDWWTLTITLTSDALGEYEDGVCWGLLAAGYPGVVASATGRCREAQLAAKLNQAVDDMEFDFASDSGRERVQFATVVEVR